MSDALAELGARLAAKNRLRPDVLFGPQRDFVYDESRMKVACTTRRAGKSTGLGFGYLLNGDKYPGCTMPYVTQARETARDIIWPALEALDNQLELGLSFKRNTGDVVMPNGSRIVLRGCGTRKEIDKLRGIKTPIVGVDEAQGIPADEMQYLVGEVLQPCLLDYKGTICLTGTPNAACAGYFYDAVHGNMKDEEAGLEWSVHSWSLFDNPYIPDVEEQLALVRATNGWTEDSPAYIREYLGQWVRDSEGLVFHFDHHRNLSPWDESLADDWEYVLGIDVGYTDPTAFVVLGASPSLGIAYVVESWKESEMLPGRVAAEIERFQERYDFRKMVIDAGGFGKTYAEDLRQTYKIPVEPSAKTKKASAIQMVNNDLRTGALLVDPHNRALIQEMELLQWRQDKLERGILEVDDRRFPDHLCDALLYAHRMHDFKTSTPGYDPPRPGEEAWLIAKEDAIEAAQDAKFQRMQIEKEWFDD